MESKEKKYVICRIYKNGIDRYFVGLFNWGKTYKVAFIWHPVMGMIKKVL